MHLESLTVLVKDADHLLKTDILGKSDPFLQLTVDTQVKTTTVKKGSSPTWEEEFKFQLSDVPSYAEVLKLEMFDKDMMGKDFMGEGMVSFESIKSEPILKVVPLQKDGKPAGHVRVLLTGHYKGTKTATSGSSTGGSHAHSSHAGHSHAAHSSHTAHTAHTPSSAHTASNTGQPLVMKRMTVVVVDGHDLKDTDLIGKPDPTVYITAGSQKANTTKKKNTCEPVWNEEFSFNGDFLKELDLEVKDKDLLGSDTMGKGKLVLDQELLRDIKAHGSTTRSVPLLRKNKPVGNINLRLSAEFHAIQETVSMKPQTPKPSKPTTTGAGGLLKKSSTHTAGSSTHKSSHSAHSAHGTHTKHKPAKTLSALERMDMADGKMDGLYHGHAIGESRHTAHKSAHGDTHTRPKYSGRCTNCEWCRAVLPVRELEYHLKNECRIAPMTCDAIDTEFPSTRCTFKCKGAEAMKNHRARCQYQAVDCPNGLCKVTNSRRSAGVHAEVCPYHTLTCPLCKMEFYRMDQDYHLSVCNKKEIACPLGCGQKMARQDLPKHLEREYMMHSHEALVAKDYLPVDHPSMVYAVLLKELKSLRAQAELGRNAALCFDEAGREAHALNYMELHPVSHDEEYKTLSTYMHTSVDTALVHTGPNSYNLTEVTERTFGVEELQPRSAYLDGLESAGVTHTAVSYDADAAERAAYLANFKPGTYDLEADQKYAAEHPEEIAKLQEQYVSMPYEVETRPVVIHRVDGRPIVLHGDSDLDERPTIATLDIRRAEEDLPPYVIGDRYMMSRE